MIFPITFLNMDISPTVPAGRFRLYNYEFREHNKELRDFLAISFYYIKYKSKRNTPFCLPKGPNDTKLVDFK